MAQKFLLYDTTTHKTQPSLLGEADLGVNKAKNEFDILSEGATQVTLSFSIILSDDIDVWVNGRLLREGVTKDFTFDYVNDKVIFNYGLHLDDWVKVRRY